MNYCARCGLPETGKISLDASGVCFVCRDWESYRPETGGDVRPVIDDIRRRGTEKAFDCVVGVSGGRDSTYMLFKLVRDFHLRCAAVFVKNAFTPRETVENVLRMTDALGVRLFRFEIDTEKHIATAKKMIGYWKKTRNPLFSNLACAPCKLSNRYIFQVAIRNDIPSIVYGGNPYEFFYAGPGDTSKSRKGRFSAPAMAMDALVKAARGIALLIENPGLLRYLPLIVQAAVLYCNQYSVFLKFRHRNIQAYDFFYHYHWDETEMLGILDALGWKKPEGCLSTWRADCEFEEVKNYIFMKTVGISHVHSLYSNLARWGVISREEAIRRARTEAFSRKRLELALEKMSMEYCPPPEEHPAPGNKNPAASCPDHRRFP